MVIVFAAHALVGRINQDIENRSGYDDYCAATTTCSRNHTCAGLA